MSIKAYIQEIEKLKLAIKSNNQINKNMRKRIHELEFNIEQYLESKGQPGFKDKQKGKAYIVENKQVPSIKKKKEKEADSIEFFRKLGSQNPEEEYAKFINIQKGELVEKKVLKIQKIKKANI